MVVAEFQVGQVLWSLIWLTLVVMWILLVIRVFADIFRSHDMSGVAKALWVLLVVATPYLGVLLYLIVRGGSMARRDLAQAQARDDALRAYIRDAAGGSSGVDELHRLADLRDRGVLDEDEFQRLKARIVEGHQPA